MSAGEPEGKGPAEDGKSRRGWIHTPPLPLQVAPYWDWPLKPLASLRYLATSWNPKAQRFFFLLMALIAWTWFTPDLERAREISFDWIFEIWLRDLVIMLVIVGGLHIALWRKRVQGDEYRFDSRPMPQKTRTFHFGNQVWDNMFWTLGPALAFAVFWESLMWHAYARGWASMITFESNPVWFTVLIVLVPLWAGFYFYWQHRLLHVGWLYDRVHSWHHKNVNTGPWSGLAMHPVESFVLMSDTLIFFVVASHPVHVIFLLFHHVIGAPTSHAGFENLKVGKSVRLEIGDFFHQLHHKFFDCNYGSWETPWDRWFGTFHDGTQDGDALIAQRRRELRSSAK